MLYLVDDLRIVLIQCAGKNAYLSCDHMPFWFGAVPVYATILGQEYAVGYSAPKPK